MTNTFTPPMINGVSASKLYLEKITPTPNSIYEFLCHKFHHISAKDWQKRFEDGQIFSEKGDILHTSSGYEYGTTIFYYRFLANEITIPFAHEILWQNNEIMLVDKPHFLAVTPTGEYVQETLLTRLKISTKNPDLTPIHRLDRETAGLILISKNPATRHLYQRLFADNAIKKTYHAIAPFCQNHTFPITIHLHLERGDPFYVMRVNNDKTPNSTTHISVLAHKNDFAKYELCPITGKMHQLRVHLNHLGTPILNDPFYPTIHHKDKGDFTAPLQLLAKRLVFTDPITGMDYDFESKQELYLPE